MLWLLKPAAGRRVKESEGGERMDEKQTKELVTNLLSCTPACIYCYAPILYCRTSACLCRRRKY